MNACGLSIAIAYLIEFVHSNSRIIVADAGRSRYGTLPGQGDAFAKALKKLFC
jgi:hypothetical protein